MSGKVLFNNKQYTVCLFDKMLVVTSERRNGKLIRKDHPQFNDWVECFNNAMDNIEMLSLIKGFLKC